MSKRLGCLSPIGILAAIVALAGMAVLTLLNGPIMFSPGALNAEAGARTLGGITAHVQLTEDCAACHASPWSGETMAGRCVACHEDVRAQIAEGSGFHGGLAKTSAGSTCRGCHPEHGGPSAALTVIDPATFPHDLTGYTLRGHERAPQGSRTTCADCHGQDVLTFDQGACATCHTDRDAGFMQPHVAAFGAQCLSCHDGVDRYGASFDHNALPFNLEGVHASTPCAGCHSGATTVQALQETSPECVACHSQEDVHQGGLGGNCERCHTPVGWAEAYFDHATAAFTLTGAHVQVACEGCHKDKLFKGTPTICFACHSQDDPHQGLLGEDCSSCHRTHSWQDASFDHATSAFSLTGAHAQVACDECHESKAFVGTPTTCVGCHTDDDPHKGQLGQRCEGCHNTTKWQDVAFDHATSAFPLTGGHVQVACEGCHKDKLFAGTPTSCVGCHSEDDVHQGQLGQGCADCHVTDSWREVTFDHGQSAFPLTGAHVPVTCEGCHKDKLFKGTPTACVGCHSQDDVHKGALGQGCQGCHVTENWRSVTFDHARSAFPLTGRHTQVRCDQCHKDPAFKGTPSTCFGCHANQDAHQGRFGQGCEACHKTTSWQDATFDHARSAFPLTGAHSPLACEQCHKSGVFRGTPTNCASCHGEPGFHAGALGNECASCHSTDGWRPAQYNRAHNRFPLDHGEGGRVGCRTCHPDNTRSYTCYGCHEHQPSRIQSEHAEEGISNIKDCIRCHEGGREGDGDGGDDDDD